MIPVVLILTVGLIAGWLATNFVEGSGYGGIGDIVIGIVGAFIGGYLFDFVGLSFSGFWGSVFVSVVGAVLFLYTVKFFTGDRAASS